MGVPMGMLAFQFDRISCMVMAELMEHSVYNNTIIKVNSENLKKNGELSFPLNLNAWKGIFWRQCCDKCNNILTHYLHLRDGIIHNLSATELIERVSQYLTLASHKWPVHIEKCSLQNEKICLFFNRPSTIRTALISAYCESPYFGHIQPRRVQRDAYYLAFQPDNESELTNLRLSLISDFSKNVLRMQGFDISKDTSQSQKIMFTVKSQGFIEDNYKRYLCGVVQNSETKSKEICFTYKQYMANKINKIEQLNEDKNIFEDYNGQRSEFFYDMAKVTIVFELLGVKPNRTIYVNNIDSEKSIMCMKEASFVQYNVARIANILNRYKEDVCKGVYPSLPNIQDINFSLLVEEEEWDLIYNYILKYPRLIMECIIHHPTFRISPQLLCLFLSRLCHTFSTYYRRIRILTEGREHLIPRMFARLYMLEVLQNILHDGLSLLGLNPVLKM